MNGFVFGVIILAVGTGVLGCLGVIAYFRIRENIRFLLDGHKIQHGRLTVAENTIRVQIDNYAALEKKYQGVCEHGDELQKCVQKISSSLGQLKKQDTTNHEQIWSSHVDLMNCLDALAKELGYEVKTVDSGPCPQVTKLSTPAVRAVK